MECENHDTVKIYYFKSNIYVCNTKVESKFNHRKE